MSQYKINNIELDIDMEDADFQEKYQKAFEKMEKAENDIAKVGDKAMITRMYCHMFYSLFDDIFGDGTGDKLFNGKCNSRVCEETYECFLDVCQKQVEDASKRRMRSNAKYRPKRNK